MQKVSLFLLIFFLGVCVRSYAQTTTPPADFFAGKWEIVIVGIPDGDAKLLTELVRKDGKLTGELTNTKDPNAEKIKIDSISEEGGKLNMAFNARGNDVTMELAKVDDDNLKGSIMGGMFETSAKRIKE